MNIIQELQEKLQEIPNTVKEENWSQEEKDLFFTAMKHAEELHEGQNRGKNTPYVTHPYKVALNVFDWGTQSSTVIISAILHDIIEDCCQSMGIGQAAALRYFEEEYTTKISDTLSELTLDHFPMPYYKKVDKQLQSYESTIVKISDFKENAGNLQELLDDTGNIDRVKRLVKKYREVHEILVKKLNTYKNEALEDNTYYPAQRTLEEVNNSLTELSLQLELHC